MSELTLRRGKPRDVDTIVNWMSERVELHCGRPLMQGSTQDLSRQISTAINVSTSNDRLRSAELDGQLVGFVWWTLVRDETNIRRAFVQGFWAIDDEVASELLSDMADYCQKRGLWSLDVHITFPPVAGTKPFYDVLRETDTPVAALTLRVSLEEQTNAGTYLDGAGELAADDQAEQAGRSADPVL